MENRFKFRAYVKSLKAIFPVTLIDFQSETVAVDRGDADGIPVEYKFDEVVLMQCTGLEDKNGENMVFEGDRVKDSEETGVVVYDEACFFVDSGRARYPLSEFYPHELEIIGNVHMNPELLEVENEML